MGQRDKEIIETTCSQCGTPLQIKYGTYRKTRGQPHLCRACRGKQESERIQSLPEEERIAYLSNKNSHISGGWKAQSAERKAQISADRKEAWANDPERKAAHCERMSQRWKDMSDERRRQQIDAMLKGQAAFWADEDNYKRMAQEARDRWYAQPPEVQKFVLDALAAGQAKYLASLTEDDLVRIKQKISTSSKRWWDGLSDEEYENKIQLLNDGLSRYLLAQDNVANEIDLRNEFNIARLSYDQYWRNETKHPEFDKLFQGKNPVKPEARVMWKHEWDFIVHTLRGNVLVDIDGSIHDNKNNQSPYRMFNDSQRPYQTDGLPAYIVQCYDNKLKTTTPVLDLVSGATISFHDFMMRLQCMNQSDADVKEMLKLLRK